MWKRLCWNEMIISLQCDYNNDVYDGDLKDIGPLDSDEYAPECHSMALPVGRVGIQGRGLSDGVTALSQELLPGLVHEDRRRGDRTFTVLQCGTGDDRPGSLVRLIPLDERLVVRSPGRALGQSHHTEPDSLA